METVKPHPCHELRLIPGGKAFFELMESLIHQAKKSIHLHTYIFTDDATGVPIAEALIQAAQREVKVMVLVDGYASQGLPKAFILRLLENGVRFRFFAPLFKSRHFYFGRRLHHKVLVVDGEVALVCGMNIADRYNDLHGRKAWLDMGILLKGPAAPELEKICHDLWTKRNKLGPWKPERPSPVMDACGLRICRNDWLMQKQEISDSYKRIFKEAREDITILCSYFLPGTTFRNRLQRAVKRGVRVRVVLAGESDIRIVKYAERYLYRWMLRNQIEIYEYRPTVLHAKMAIADNQVITIGSYNINDLSALASIELNVEVRDPDFIRQARKQVNAIIENDCLRISPKAIRLYSFSQLLQFFSFYIIRVLLYLTTFYLQKDKLTDP